MNQDFMAEWLVRLEGEKSGLEDLSRLRSPDWSVSKREDGYYLRSTGFNLLTDAHDVRECATQILDVVSGLAKLIYGNFQAVKVSGIMRVEEDGKPPQQFIMPLSISCAEAFGTPSIVTSGETESSQAPNIMESVLEIASQEKPVREALARYGGLEHNWQNLYNILEIVKGDVGGENALIKKPWSPSGKLKLFKQTANSPLAIGHEARHGSAAHQPPQQPMSLSEAKYLIRDILDKWLRSKLPRSP